MNYLRRRIVTYVIVFAAAIQLNFILPRLVPGNAAEILASANAFAPAEQALLMARFGLNQPVTTQYLIYLKNIFLTWPPFFGVSYQFYPTTVSDLIATRVAWTAVLIGVSFVLATIISYGLVAIGSVRRQGKFELGSLYTAIMLHATPLYWIAMVFLWVFAATLKWFPMFGSSAFTVTSTLGFIESAARHAALPIIAMTLSQIGENFLLLRGSTQEILNSDFVVAAKSRGLTNGDIATRYILRNSLLPFISILSFSMSSLISRVVLVEAVFGYPGIGDLIVDAVVSRDYPVLQGAFFFVVVFVIIGGIIGDLLLVRLDPRIRR